MGLDYLFRRRGALTMAPSQVGIFARSSREYATANLEFHIQPLSLDRWGEGMHPFGAFTASVCNLRPSSRGSVHAIYVRSERRAGDPAELSVHGGGPASCDRQYPADTARIVAQEPLARYRPEEFKPGASLQRDDEILRAVQEIATTIFHPVGTAKMGPATDPMAVLDERLRVRGVAALRVADASIMPTITSGNTNSPSIMIGEKAAG